MSEQSVNTSNVPQSASQSSSMKSYRAYKIGWEGRIIAVAHLDDCIDDVGAIDAAKKLAWGYVVEVWDCERFVAKLPCDQDD